MSEYKTNKLVSIQTFAYKFTPHITSFWGGEGVGEWGPTSIANLRGNVLYVEQFRETLQKYSL